MWEEEVKPAHSPVHTLEGTRGKYNFWETGDCNQVEHIEAHSQDPGKRFDFIMPRRWDEDSIELPGTRQVHHQNQDNSNKEKPWIASLNEDGEIRFMF